MKGFGLIDDIVPEPFGGAHWDYDAAAASLKAKILEALAEVKDIAPATPVLKIELRNIAKWASGKKLNK